MKKIIFLFILTLMFTNCIKKTQSLSSNRPENQNVENDTDKPIISKINFEEIKQQIESSEKMTPEIFVFISVLHKNYITTLEETELNLTDEELHTMFEKQKKDFFNTIKYSEEEYTNFMQKNSDAISIYIAKNTVFKNFLTIQDY